MHETSTILIAALAVLFIGLSKAGFGGGLGMLTTPLCVFAFGPKQAIGILLPLLCAGDAFSLYHYWGKWERRNLKFLLPGVVIGVVIGVQLIGRFSARELNIAIGLLAVAFVVFQFVKEIIFRAEGASASVKGMIPTCSAFQSRNTYSRWSEGSPSSGRSASRIRHARFRKWRRQSG